jgi:hypothetical protein
MMSTLVGSAKAQIFSTMGQVFSTDSTLHTDHMLQSNTAAAKTAQVISLILKDIGILIQFFFLIYTNSGRPEYETLLVL